MTTPEMLQSPPPVGVSCNSMGVSCNTVTVLNGAHRDKLMGLMAQHIDIQNRVLQLIINHLCTVRSVTTFNS